jgi:phage baseplate assembly protein W
MVWEDISYPLGSTVEEFVTPKDDAAVLKTAIINMLTTRPGEYVMHPTFGAGISDLVFEPNDDLLVSEIESRIRDMLLEWDDRLSVEIAIGERTEHSVEIRMVFRNNYDPLAELERFSIFIEPDQIRVS